MDGTCIPDSVTTAWSFEVFGPSLEQCRGLEPVLWVFKKKSFEKIFLTVTEEKLGSANLVSYTDSSTRTTPGVPFFLQKLD